MTIQQIKERINGMSSAQVKRFNQTCSTKLYDESNAILSQEDEEEADDLSIEVDGLSAGAYDDLNSQLSSSRKGRGRPC